MKFEEQIRQIIPQFTPDLLKNPWRSRVLDLGAHPLTAAEQFRGHGGADRSRAEHDVNPVAHR